MDGLLRWGTVLVLCGTFTRQQRSRARPPQPGDARVRRMRAETGGCGSRGGEVNGGGRVNKFFDY